MESKDLRSRRETVARIVEASDSCSTPELLVKAKFLKNHLLKNKGESDFLFWSSPFSLDHEAIIKDLCDVIIPDDELGPAASELSVQDFIIEWVSIPSPGWGKVFEQFDNGLRRIDQIAQEKFDRKYLVLSLIEKEQVLESILAKRKSTEEPAYRFFIQLRKLAGVAYYTTVDGHSALGFVRGNSNESVYKGPPPQIMQRLEI